MIHIHYDFMVQYRLTCKKCDIDHTHHAESIEGIRDFWVNWNRQYGENMKCLHDYNIETLD
jgi:hypothetical protein